MSKTKAELLKDNERLQKRVASLERAMDRRTVASKESKELRVALAEALEQQTATSEILRVISQSPTDVQPIFDTIVLSATQLCADQQTLLIGFEGEMLTFLGSHNNRPEGQAALGGAFPQRATLRSGRVRDSSVNSPCTGSTHGQKSSSIRGTEGCERRPTLERVEAFRKTTRFLNATDPLVCFVAPAG